MFRRVANTTKTIQQVQVRTKVGAFSVFLKESYADKTRRQLLDRCADVSQRGTLLAKWYRALPKSELDKLVKKGDKMATPIRKKSSKKELKANRPKRAPTDYNIFVKKHMNKPEIAKLGDVARRMKAIAKLWKLKNKGAKVAKAPAARGRGRRV